MRDDVAVYRSRICLLPAKKKPLLAAVCTLSQEPPLWLDSQYGWFDLTLNAYRLMCRFL
jgi:hypothetical protein